jgi:hypothetical protein
MTLEAISWDLLLLITSTGLGFAVAEWSAKTGFEGFDRWLRPKVFSYSGIARDGYVPIVRHLGSPLKPSLLDELKKDFKRERDHEYTIESIEVRYFRKRITCRGAILLRDPDGKQFRNTFTGKGEFVTGNINRGAISIALNCRDDQFAWKVICLFRYAEPTQLHGYWFGDDGTAPGRFTMGIVQLTANAS